MTWTVRIVAVAMVAALMLGLKQFAQFTVNEAGILGGVALLGAIFWLAIFYENRDRKADGMPRFGWSDFRKDMLLPICGIAAIIMVGYWLR